MTTQNRRDYCRNWYREKHGIPLDSPLHTKAMTEDRLRRIKRALALRKIGCSLTFIAGVMRTQICQIRLYLQKAKELGL